MALPVTASDMDNAIQEYVAGKGARTIAARLRIGAATFKLELAKRGIAIRSTRAAAMMRDRGQVIPPSVLDRAVVDYLRGDGGLEAVASKNRIGAKMLKHELLIRGLGPRDAHDAGVATFSNPRHRDFVQRFAAAGAEATRKRVAQSREHIKRIAPLAWSATRGSTHSELHQLRRADTHQRLRLKVSPFAEKFRRMLAERGVETTVEKACGRYNIDIAAGAVAVEVHRYSFNPLGPAGAREKKRSCYFGNRGYSVVYVWISPKTNILAGAASDHVVSIIKATQRHPSAVGQYWVIRGSGELVSSGRLDRDELA